MEIISDIEQGSDEWFSLRLGSIGGSGIKKATSRGRGSAPSKTRASYMYELAYEIITGTPVEGYKNDAMQLGNDSEPRSRAEYEFEKNADVQQVCLVRSTDHKHTSPDGLVGANGVIEIKNIMSGAGYFQTLDTGMPAEHTKQIQWTLHICEREWCDFVQSHWLRKDGEIVSGYPSQPIYVQRIHRDDKLIKQLDEQADVFIEDLLEFVERIKHGRSQ